MKMRNGALATDAKGRFAETVGSTLLEYAGYRVLRLGVEEVISEVKAGVARGERYLKLPQQLRSAPDFLVVDPASGDCTLLEVKFRRRFDDRTAGDLHDVLSTQVRFWPECVTVIVCADPGEAKVGSGIRKLIRGLRAGDLARLIDPHDRLSRWERLRTLGGLFERVADENLYAEAEALILPIRGWA
jgi:hypothetical protein